MINGAMRTKNGALMLREWYFLVDLWKNSEDMAIYNVTSRDFRSRQAEPTEVKE